MVYESGEYEYRCEERPDGGLDWHRGETGIIPYWRRASDGAWIINYRHYTFEEWIERVRLPDEEKIYLKLKYG